MAVSRVNIREIEDLEVTPPLVRDAITQLLNLFHRVFQTQRLFAPKLKELMEKTKQSQLVDLCSGAGGVVPLLLAELAKHGIKASATCTDLYPNEDAIRYFKDSEDPIEYFAESVSATNVPASLPGVRTLIAGFHHLDPQAAYQVLENAFNQRQPITIFEITCNKPWWAFLFAAASIPGVLALTPFYWPKVSQFILTYLIPVIPMVGAIDGFLSHFRTYSEAELLSMTSGLSSSHYVWEIGAHRHPLAAEPWPYLLGYPIND